MNTYQATRTFLYRNARPIDLARWQYHFEKGSREAVLTALAAYQNEDGGFGHALEADSWNPNSTPIQTWVATEILREIGFTDASHPIIQGILTYLASGQDFENNVWANTVLSNNDYPHAPWWQTESESTAHHSYNPTACLAGFVIRFANRESELFQLGCEIAQEASDSYMTEGYLEDMHTVSCYIRLLEYVQEADVTDVFDVENLEGKLREQVKRSITHDTSKWESGYICKPSQFFNSKESIFYSDNKEIANYECEYIVQSQLPDGSWHIPWDWADYPEEWAISKNWWKGHVVVSNMLYMKGMDKL